MGTNNEMLPVLLFNRAGWADTMSEHNSMGFLGVKKRHPYPLGKRSCGVETIFDY